MTPNWETTIELSPELFTNELVTLNHSSCIDTGEGIYPIQEELISLQFNSHMLFLLGLVDAPIVLV